MWSNVVERRWVEVSRKVGARKLPDAGRSCIDRRCTSSLTEEPKAQADMQVLDAACRSAGLQPRRHAPIGIGNLHVGATGADRLRLPREISHIENVLPGELMRRNDPPRGDQRADGDRGNRDRRRARSGIRNRPSATSWRARHRRKPASKQSPRRVRRRRPTTAGWSRTARRTTHAA